MKIKITFIMTLYIIFLSIYTVNANNDYVCSSYTSECKSVVWEKNSDGTLKFRQDGTNHGFGTRTNVTRYGNTRAGCPKATDSYSNSSFDYATPIPNCIPMGLFGEQTCGQPTCPAGYTLYISYDEYSGGTTCRKSKKIGGAYGAIGYGNYQGYGFGDVNNGQETCELVRYDNSAPDINVTKNEFQATGSILSYTGNIPCNLSNGADNSSFCNSVKNNSGTIKGYTGNIPCNLSNGVDNLNFCVPNYEIIDKYTASATCKDDKTNIESGKIGNSGCDYTNSILGAVTKESYESHIFNAFDKAGNNTKCDAKTPSSCLSTIACEINNSCIPINNSNITSCEDNDDPVGAITYSLHTCTNQSITVTNTCISDATCGCRASPENIATLNIPSNSHNTLGIADKAGNVTDLSWNVNWIDKTVPFNLQFVTTNQKASQDNFFMLSVEDNAPSGLCNEEYLDYELKITGPETKTLIGKLKYDGTPKKGILGLTKLGTYNFSLKVTDQAGNVTTKNDIPSIKIVPSDLDVSKTTLSVGSTNNKYADNQTYYDYTLNLKDEFGNPINGKKIDKIEQDCGSTSGCETIKTDMVNNSGKDALLESNYGETSDENGKVTFILKSLSPGKFTQRFNISMNKWDVNYLDTDETQSIIKTVSSANSFKKPFTGELKASKDNGTTWNDLPEIGTNMKYKLQVKSISSVNSINTILDNFKSYVKVTDEINTVIQGLSDIYGLLSKDSTFNSRVNTSTSATSLGIAGIQISDNNKTPIIISYVLGGENVKYYLSSDDLPESRSIIKIENTNNSFLGVKVIGSLQGAGKQAITLQSSNFSDLAASDMRTTIRQNAYKYVLSMKSGDIVGGVKYVVGDITLSGTTSYETLVVKDGNVIINGDLNISNSKFGIIVLKDGYNVNIDYSNKGNIYVKPNVKTINAIIYADGGIISVDSSGNPYTSDTTDRTSQLKNQLIMNGSLFTRNTIGGAILAGGKYILPGGSKINDFDKAMIYDLNYIRRGNAGWDVNGNLILDTGEYKDPFVVKYNSTIQTNPPKLFGN